MTALTEAVAHLRTTAVRLDTTPEVAAAITVVLDVFTRQLDTVQGLAFAHRWDTTGSAHTLAGRILDVLNGGLK